MSSSAENTIQISRGMLSGWLKILAELMELKTKLQYHLYWGFVFSRALRMAER